MLFDYCRAQADTAAGDVAPMDLSMLGKVKGKKGKGDKKGEGKGKKKRKQPRRERTKTTTRRAKAKGKPMPKRLSTFLDTVFSAKSGDTRRRIAGGTRAPRAGRTRHLWRRRPRQLRTLRPIAGTLTQSEGEVVPAIPAQWLDPVTRRGLGAELGSATGHQFATAGNTTISSRTRDRINVAGDFRVALRDTGLQRSKISVGQVCNKDNIITPRITGGTILNEFTGSRIEFKRAGGVYRLGADMTAKTKSGTGGVKVLMGFLSKKDTEGGAEAQSARPGNLPVLPSESEVEQHELKTLAIPKLVLALRSCQGQERSGRRVEVRHRLFVHG